MHILMLTPRFPYPPTRGDAVRAWGELEYLAQRHDLWLACVDEHPPPPAHLAPVRNICRDVVVAPRSRLACLAHGWISLLRGRSLTEGFFGSAALERVLRNWSQAMQFDAILTFSSAVAGFAELVGADRRVLDLCDVDSHKWAVYAERSRAPLCWLYASEARRLAAAERRSVRMHDVTLVVNERERHRLLTQLNPRRSDVIRTCVETADTTGADRRNGRPAVPPEPIVGSVGSMFYPPNVRAIEWFGGNVWPRIREAVPEARWWIVGNRPVRRVRRWSREPGVTVTGFVPDVRPYLDALRVFVNPVDGDIGVQTKLIFALAAGKPAVVTPDTAAGIDYRGEPPFLIARSPAEFAAAVVRVLSDDALAERLSVGARLLIEDNYQRQQQLRRVEQWLMGEPPDEQSATEPREKQASAEQRKAVTPAVAHSEAPA